MKKSEVRLMIREILLKEKTLKSKDLINEQSDCKKKFQNVLFGEFKKFYTKSEREENTTFEQKIWSKIYKWVRGEYTGSKRDAALGKAFDELSKCKAEYPKVLKNKKNILYRGFRKWSHTLKADGQYIKKVLDWAKKQDVSSFNKKKWAGIIFYCIPYTYSPESKFQSWSTTPLYFDNGFLIKAKVPENETLFSSTFLNAVSREFGYGSENEVIRIGGNINCELIIPSSVFWILFPETKVSFQTLPWKRGQKLNWPGAPELRGKQQVAFQRESNKDKFKVIVLMKGRKNEKTGKRYKDKYIDIPVKELLKYNPIPGINPEQWTEKYWGKVDKL